MERMMKLVLMSLLSIILLAAGCQLEQSAEEYGSLTLSLAQKARSFSSDLDTEITGYSITLEHAVSLESSEYTLTEGSTLSLEAIRIGTWQITVEGYNQAAQVVATGSTSVEVKANRTKSAYIPLTYVGGEGTLEVEVSWDTGEFYDPEVSVEVLPFGIEGAQWIDLGSMQEGAEGSLVLSSPLENGLYTIRLTVTDSVHGSVSTLDTLQIHTGSTTAARFTFDVAEGSLILEITGPEQGLLFPGLFGIEEGQQFDYSESLSLQVTCDLEEPELQYTWYLNAQELSEQQRELTLTGLLPDQYTLTCIITDGTSLGSASLEFSVFDGGQQ